MSHSPRLSPEGRARRDAMLPDLIGAMHELHQKRHRRRRAGAVALLAVGAVVIGMVAVPRSPSAPRLADRTSPAVTPAPAPESNETAPAWEIVRASRVAPDWIVRASRPTRVELIDDATLIAEMAAMNQPTGVIRMGDDVWLTREPADAAPEGRPTSDRGGGPPVAHALAATS